MSVISPEFNVTYEISDGGAIEWAGDDAFFDYEPVDMPDLTVAAQQEDLMAEYGDSSHSSDGTQGSAAEVTGDDVGALKTNRSINRLDTLRAPKIRFAAYAFALVVASPTVGEACTSEDYKGPGSGPALDPVREWLRENTVRKSDSGGSGGGGSFCEEFDNTKFWDRSPQDYQRAREEC